MTPLLVVVLVLVLLSTVAAALALFSQQWALEQVKRAVPAEGLYWSVAQYQFAHLRLKQEVRAVADGERPDHEAIQRRWAVLASRASILNEPSAIRSLLEGVSGFEQAAQRIAAWHQRIAPLLDGPEPLSPAGAQQLLRVFSEADDEALLGQLGNDARQAELLAKERSLSSLRQRLRWLWMGFAVCWTVLALWLLQAVHSARRLAQLAEERRQAVVAMERAITTKRSFVSMVSHELRSPLQSIVTASESLSLDIALGQSRPQSAAALRRIHRSVSSLQAQLRDLLSIARSDTTALNLQPETFECAALVHDVCVEFEDAALARGLVLAVHLPDEPQTVRADPIRVAQVLRNLLQNAIRYTDAGRIDVQLLPQPQSGQPSDAAPCMCFSVCDTGPGLPAAAIERLTVSEAAFNPDAETPPEGMRIGLFVIRDVLRQLGGRIDVASAPGQGTVARVEIPVQITADAEVSLPTGNTMEELRILVVDDSTEVLTAMRSSAAQLGHVCDAAGSPGEALRLLASNRYDAVLIDLHMPGQTGLELAREIRASGGPNAQSMLILMSAPDNGAWGQQPPFDGFLAKPASSHALVGLIGSRTRR